MSRTNLATALAKKTFKRFLSFFMNIVWFQIQLLLKSAIKRYLKLTEGRIFAFLDSIRTDFCLFDDVNSVNRLAGPTLKSVDQS
jgi:hypothetical protein